MDEKAADDAIPHRVRFGKLYKCILYFVMRMRGTSVWCSRHNTLQICQLAANWCQLAAGSQLLPLHTSQL